MSQNLPDIDFNSDASAGVARIKRFASFVVLVALLGFAFSPPCHAAEDWPTYPMPAKPADMPAYALLVGIRSSLDQCLKAAGDIASSAIACTGAEYDYQAQRLERSYRQLRASLDKDRGQQLQDEQRRWASWRSQQCDPGRVQFPGYGCQIETAADRATHLEYHYAHGCYRIRCGRNLQP